MHHRGLGLGRIHRHLGARQQGIRFAGVLGPAGNTDAGAQVHRLVFKFEWQLERLRNPLGHGHRALGVALRQQHRKFVAAQPGHHVTSPQVLLRQAFGHRYQQQVAKRITQHVVDVFEAVDVQHHDGNAPAAHLGHRPLAVDLALHRSVKTRPVRQAGQTVPIGQPADFGLLGADVDAHGVKRLGQTADFVVPVHVFHLDVVLTLAQSLGSTYQRAQRRRDAPGRNHAANAKQHYAHRGDPGQRDLCLAKRRHHFVDRTQQQGSHAARQAVAELHVTPYQSVAADWQLHHVAGHGLQRAQSLGGQGGRKNPGTLATALGNEGHVHLRQGPHVVHLLLAHGKAHQHPAHQHRRFQGHHHKLVRRAPDQRNLAALRITRKRCHELAEHRPQSSRILAIAHGAQHQMGVHQRRHGGTDARAVVFQRRTDSVDIARIHGRTETKVRRQHSRTLAECLRVLVQQAAPHPLSNRQFLRHLAPRALVNTDAHHTEYRRLHQQQQQQRQGDDARGQAPVVGPPFQFHGATPDNLNVFALSAAPTTSAWSAAGAPTASPGCQTRMR